MAVRLELPAHARRVGVERAGDAGLGVARSHSAVRGTRRLRAREAVPDSFRRGGGSALRQFVGDGEERPQPPDRRLIRRQRLDRRPRRLRNHFPRLHVEEAGEAGRAPRELPDRVDQQPRLIPVGGDRVRARPFVGEPARGVDPRARVLAQPFESVRLLRPLRRASPSRTAPPPAPTRRWRVRSARAVRVRFEAFELVRRVRAPWSPTLATPGRGVPLLPGRGRIALLSANIGALCPDPAPAFRLPLSLSLSSAPPKQVRRQPNGREQGFWSGPAWIRTKDQRIMSPLL